MSAICDLLYPVQGKIDQLWPDSAQARVDESPDLVALDAVLSNQTVNMPQLLQMDGKKRTVKIEWLTDCAPEPEECTDECDIDGREFTPACKDYELTCISQRTYKLPVAHTDTFQSRVDYLAKGIMQNHKLIAQDLAQYIIAGLFSNLGVNQFDGGIGTVAGTTTYINPLNWNDSIWAYFARVKRLNKIGEEYFIDGGNLFNLIYNRTFEAANADGKGNFAKIPANKVWSDLENLSESSGTTFMIGKSAVALVTLSPADFIWPVKNPTMTNPYERVADLITYTETNMFDPRVRMEVTAQRKCIDGVDYDVIRHKAFGVFAHNPTPCNAEQTGILRFECGTNAVN